MQYEKATQETKVASQGKKLNFGKSQKMELTNLNAGKNALWMAIVIVHGKPRNVTEQIF